MSIIRVIIPGYGKPKEDEKLAIFKTNMELLHKTCPRNFSLDVHLHIYDDTLAPEGEFPLTIHRAPGIVGEFIEKHTKSIDHDVHFVLILLDDVELQPSFNLDQAIQIQETYKIDILSPTLTDNSATFYPYMRSTYGPMYSHLPSDNTEYPCIVPLLRITYACELFCYLMPVASFLAWSAHIDLANPWLWGMDLLLSHAFNLRVGMIPFMTATHYFQKSSYDIDPFVCFHTYLSKYGETQLSLSRLPSIKTTVPLLTLYKYDKCT